MSDKAKNSIKSYFQEQGTKAMFYPGRAKKKFLDFRIIFLNKEDATSTTYFEMLDKKRIYLHAEGHPARVLDTVLNEVDLKYHQDIIDHYSSKKLFWMANNLHEEDINEFSNEVKAGFALNQKVKGRKPPKIFKPDVEVKSGDQNFKFEVKSNPHAFKSAATKEVIDLGIYEHLTPAEILTTRLNLTGATVPELAAAVRFDISTVYNHVKGTRDVDRKAALRYAGFFNCNPADILFPPIKIPLTGKCDFFNKRPGIPACEVEISYTNKETVLCPRDFYSGVGGETKAIKINSPGSVYDGHVAYYYFTNKKEADCQNKICFIGVDNGLTILEGSTDYFIGIYENYRGKTKILNPDPYRNKEIILEDPKIKFITPIIGMVNIDKVKFSPIQEREVKKLSDNQKLKKLEKELELSEQHWWIENQKLSGKSHTAASTVRKMEKMFKDLREQRIKVQQLRGKILREGSKDLNIDYQQKMSDFINDMYYPDEEDQKRA